MSGPERNELVWKRLNPHYFRFLYVSHIIILVTSQIYKKIQVCIRYLELKQITWGVAQANFITEKNLPKPVSVNEAENMRA